MKLQKSFALALLVALVTCVLSLTGCGLPSLGGNGQRDIVDNTGAHVSVPKTPSRIISVGAATDDIILSLVDPNRVVAISGTANNVPNQSAQVQGRVTSSVESVVSFNPDLVIIPDYVGPDVIQSLRDAGLPVYVYIVPRSIEESKNLILSLADLVGAPDKGQAVVRDMDGKIKAIDQSTAGASPQKSVAYMTSTGLAGGVGSVFDDMTHYIHFKNAAADLGYSQFVTGTREDVVAYNPDVIIVPTNDYGDPTKPDATVDDILRDPAFANVKAVKNKEVYQVDAKPFMTYSQYMVDAMDTLAHDLYGY